MTLTGLREKKISFGHQTEAIPRQMQALAKVDAGGAGSSADVVSALRKMGQHFADETVNLLP